MHKEIGVGKAHSKIILIGEHAVVYGYPAIAPATPSYRSDLPDYPGRQSMDFVWRRHLVHGGFASLEHLGIRRPVRCRIQSMVPEKLGWGPLRRSVSQLFVQFFDYYQEELDDETLEIPGQSSRNHCPYESNPDSMPRPVWAIKPLNSSECRLLPARAGYKSELGDCGYGDSRQYREAIQKVEAKGQEVLSHFHEIG